MKYNRIDESVAYELIEGDIGGVEHHEMPSMLGPGHTDHSTTLSDGRYISWSPLDGEPSIVMPTNWIPLTEPFPGIRTQRLAIEIFQLPEWSRSQDLGEVIEALITAGMVNLALSLLQCLEDLTFDWRTY